MKELGTIIDYDGKKNLLIYEGEVYEYSIGSLLCGYERLNLNDLKDIIFHYENKEDKFSIENISNVIDYMIKETKDTFGAITSSMIMTEMIHSFEDLFDEESVQFNLNKMNQFDDFYLLKQHILQDTNRKSFSNETILDALIYAYYYVYLNYGIFKQAFSKIMAGTINSIENDANKVFSLYTDLSEYQDIDFKLINIDGKLSSIYTIKNSISLLVFELAHIAETNGTIKRCKNCNHYFVPISRIDSIYCSYPLSKDSNQVCKDIGAKKTRMLKEKEDLFTKEYRKQYMRLQMKCRRHPNNNKYPNNLKRLVIEAKEWRSKIKKEIVNENDWKEWLEKYN